MKRHFIAFVLAAFAGVVVYLLALSIGLALSRVMLTPDFQVYKSELFLTDFIAGADVFYSILMFFLYVLLSGSFYRIFNTSIKQIKIKQILLSIIAIGLVEFAQLIKEDLTIVTQFNRMNYVLFGIAVITYLKKINEIKDGIDKVFDSFLPALIIGLCIIFILFVFSGFNFSLSGILKLTFLMSFSAFVHILSCYVLFSSFYKIEVS